MDLTLDMALLDGLRDGVVLLNRAGQITDFNRAARPWLKAFADAQTRLADQIDYRIRHKTTGPVAIQPFDLVDPPAEALRIHLCSNGPHDYALFVAPAQYELPLGTRMEATTGFFGLLGEEIRHEITHWRAELDRVAGLGPTPDIGGLSVCSQRLSRLFVAFEQLSSTSRDDLPGQSERLSLMTLTQETLSAMPRRRADYALTVAPGGSTQQHGMLYGKPELLRCALSGLLESLDDGAPPHSRIELHVRQSGRYVVLHSRFVGGVNPRAMAPVPARGGGAGLHVTGDIRLPMARRIIELHGGQLNIEAFDDAPAGRHQRDAIAGFMLVLPTGAVSPSLLQRECAECPATRQAEAYAHDLASLMTRPDSAADVSGEEIAFLMRVMSEAPAPENQAQTP
jgi:hypothetical protein